MQDSFDANHSSPSEFRLHTVAEFRERLRAFQRAALLRFAVWIAGLLGIYSAFGVICQYIQPQHEWTPLRVLLAACLITLFLSQFLLIGAMIASLEHIRRRGRVKCDHCESYLDVKEFEFAIAIHCCPYCQNPLFEEWKTTSVTDNVDTNDSIGGEFTLADLSESERKRMLAFGKSLARSFVAATIVFGVTAGALWIWYDLLSVRFGDLAPAAAKLFQLVPAFVTFSICLLWSLVWIPGDFLTCGGCGSIIQDCRDVRITGNCRTCGKRVIRDAPVLRLEQSDPEEGLLDRAEFNACIKRYWKLSGCSCAGIIGVGGLVWTRIVFWWLDIQPQGQLRIIEAVAFLSGFGVLSLICLAIERRLPKPSCPSCHQSLEGLRGLTQTTGNCCRCGRRVLKSAESNSVS